MPPRIAIAVIGGSSATDQMIAQAFAVGGAIAAAGAVLVCGGRGGVMEAAARGAQAAGGTTVGILQSYDRASANPHIEIAIATGMGHARNTIVVASADAIVALPGATGTLSEIAMALTIGRPVVALDAWREIAGVHHAATPASAVTLALELARDPARAHNSPG
jgi:uncharacterized protein (TIGR00725 family)